MAFDLFSLLGAVTGADPDKLKEHFGQQPTQAQAPIPADPRQPQAPASEPPITVSASQPDEGTRSLGNRSNIEEAQDALKNAPQHKGAFGQKGTLRNIMGVLGDAFLTQAGEKSVYAPKRQEEQDSDALSGLTSDPRAAIERLSQTNPKAAQDLFEKFQTNQLGQQNAQALAAYRGDQSDMRHFTKTQKFGQMAAQMLSGAKDPTTAVAILQKRAQALGIDLGDLGITPDMTPEEVQAIATSGMTVNQQAMLPIRQQTADSGTISANARATSAGASASNARTNQGRLQETISNNHTNNDIKKTNSNTSQYNATTQRQRANTYESNARANGATPTGTPSGPAEGMRRVINGKTYEWRNGKAVPVGGSSVPMAR